MRPVHCERCGALADVDWCDTRSYADPGPVYVMGHSACITPGCVNEDGSTAVEPPDEPGRLTREDRRWLRKHTRLGEEYARAERALREAMSE